MTDDVRETLATAFDSETDPLEQYSSTFEEVAVDSFEPFRTGVLESRDITPRTIRLYETLWRQWCEHMDRVGRHPACPSTAHVKSFAQYELDESDNSPRTVAEKLRKLNDLYRYWQNDPVFPHPTNFNPVSLARSTTDLSYPEQKEPPRLTVDELAAQLATVDHVRDHAIIFLQLKLGLRATELCNLRLEELSITDSELHDYYPEFGSHTLLDGREDAILIPHDRSGNKSRRSRVLPLDAETQEILLEYLLIRPDNDEPWVFLSKNSHEQLQKQDINKFWKRYFHPEYEETEQHRAVTSHYGRHRFTTYWRVEQDLNRELLKYMRGDTPGAATIEEMGAIDEYIHTYYEDIEPIYREDIYELTG
ncbi:tyrosine-type recombinase/integrase [Haloarchaeobius sp. HRN-SO-5]|uniref:tyrosine-type recombinase/integrase n=1 Tax=Haloarchaeobius sp. HRN-SO-5 TaxID=3446118 RepID=UPI003EBA0AC7